MMPRIWIPFLGVEIQSYGVCVAVVLLFGLLCTPEIAARLSGLPRWRIRLALIVSMLSALAGARLHYVLNLWSPYYQAHPLAALRAELTGFHAPGGFIAMALVLPLCCWLLRLPIGTLADAMATTVGVCL